MTAGNRRVLVTGLGAVTPLGGDVPSTWEGLLAGRTGIRLLDGPGYDDFPVRIGAPAAVDPAGELPRATSRKLDRCQQFAMVAAREAWRDAGLPEPGGEDALPGERLAVSIGTGLGGSASMFDSWLTLQDKGVRRFSPFTAGRVIPCAAASWVGLEYGAKAAVETPVAACATGNDALRRGWELIRSGKADVVVAGGAEALLHPFGLAIFISMRALSDRNDEPERAVRPFGKGRGGFALGEGAALMILESAEHASRRGARVYAELAGAGWNADGYDFAQPDPSGAGQTASIREALDSAGLTPEEIVHVNAHAAGTPLGDATEALSIRTVLGPHAGKAVVTSAKAAVGHLMGAAGAIESIATVLALHHRLVPPTLNQDDYDHEIALDVAAAPRALPGGPVAALNNSFGLGGHNVVTAYRSV
ncbi:beta-ketoacyl-[acyl-carrier-protein] synthase family protein [Streptomyces capoamus]|uniref:beta-ketoacyl-[acyl-carrier-protein] synthase family protein n=1 Tax=Streptomyces capoamus TaxID=68183 RepID=UPI00339527A1